MIPSAEHNRVPPKSNDLSIAPIHDRHMPEAQRSFALPEFALLLQKELEKFRPGLFGQKEQEEERNPFFEEYMTLLYRQNQMAREISENSPMGFKERDIRHSYQTLAIKDARFRAYLHDSDRNGSVLYMRYQNLYDSPAGTWFKQSI